MGDTIFSLSVIVALAFSGGMLLMIVSDVFVDLWNRLYADTGVDDVAGEVLRPPSESAAWQREAGPTSPGGPARCPLCLEFQPAVDVFFVRAHGQLVCRPCSRLTAAQASLMRTHR